MDGGAEWDEVQSWLEMAHQVDLHSLLSYLGVDMGALSQDRLVEELHWTMEHLPNCLVRAYRRLMGNARNGIPSTALVSTSRHVPSDPMADLGSLTLLMAMENRALEALPLQGIRELLMEVVGPISEKLSSLHRCHLHHFSVGAQT
jgi:hypothetical protein